MNNTMHMVLELLEQEGPLTMSEVVKRSKLSLRDVYQTLTLAETEHRVKRTGQLWHKLPGYAGPGDRIEIIGMKTHAGSQEQRRRQSDRPGELL
jgi:hypothetical protein